MPPPPSASISVNGSGVPMHVTPGRCAKTGSPLERSWSRRDTLVYQGSLLLAQRDGLDVNELRRKAIVVAHKTFRSWLAASKDPMRTIATTVDHSVAILIAIAVHYDPGATNTFLDEEFLRWTESEKAMDSWLARVAQPKSA